MKKITQKNKTLILAAILMTGFAFVPFNQVSAQTYACNVNDRACLIETISYLQRILASLQTYYVPTVTNTNYGLTSFSGNSSLNYEVNRLWLRHDNISEDTVDAYDDDYDTNEVAELLDDAADELFDAEDALRVRNTYRVQEYTLAAERYLDDAEDELDNLDRRDSRRYGGSNNNDREDARDAIDDAEKAHDDAEDEVRDTEDDGYDINEAEDFLDDARDALNDAEDAYDDRDYDDAIEFVEEAQYAIDDALDEIEYRNNNNDAIDDARDAIDDAFDFFDYVEREIEDADDDGDYVRDAEDYLDDAERYLEDAEDAYDDRDYDEVFDLVNNAERALEDALDELQVKEQGKATKIK